MRVNNNKVVSKKYMNSQDVKGRKRVFVLGDRALGGLILGKDKQVRRRQRERLGKAAMIDKAVYKLVNGEKCGAYLDSGNFTENEKRLINKAAIDIRFNNPKGIETINALRERMLKKAESVLEDMLDISATKDDENYPQLLKIKQDTAKYVTSSLAKDIYKSEQKAGGSNTFNKVTINFIQNKDSEPIKIINTQQE